MKPEFLKAVHDAIGNVEHIHIEAVLTAYLSIMMMHSNYNKSLKR